MVKKKNKYKRKGYPYKNRDGYLSLGVKTIGSTVVIGSIPNISGMPMETTVKEKYAEGMGNVAMVFPKMGKIIGTGMVLKQVGNLKKVSSKLTKKSKRKKDLI